MRKKLATKICAIVMTAAMVASMAGCGDDSGDNSQASTPGSSEAGDPGQESGGADNQESETPDDSQEEKYDFGGQVVKVHGNIWDNLKEPVPNDAGEVDTTNYDKYWGFAHEIEEKYNIKFEWVDLEGADGYNDAELTINSILNGQCYADILAVSDSTFVSMMTGDYLADITDEVDQLKVGSLWTEAGTWKGRVYGQTYDGIGDCYVLAYSRDYLKSIGMEKTPTDMFMEGKWSYEDCKAYLSEMKAKLPEGTYPISTHYYHWASMAPAANGGVVSVDSNGEIGFADPRYTAALEFYVELQNLGLAQMMEPTDKGDGTYSTSFNYGHNGGMSSAKEGNIFVMTMIEGWHRQYLLDEIGEWGIVPYPWGPEVTCSEPDKVDEEGNPIGYTTLSDNYRTVQSIWTNTVIPKQEYRNASSISDIDLFKIAKDMFDKNSPNGAAVRLAAWEAEQKGEVFDYLGDNPGSIGNFCTVEDAKIFDWLHTRVQYDWGHALDDANITNVWEVAKRTVGVKLDARSVAETYLQEAEANMEDKGLK